MKKENWVWMPHAGHFILGNYCRFHLNTYVGKYVVSTVGELWNEKEVRMIHARVHDPKWFEKNQRLEGDYFDNAYFKRFGYDDIGYKSKYETMVFKAVRDKKHLCCPWKMLTGAYQDFNSYETAETAYKGHLKMCKKWSQL